MAERMTDNEILNKAKTYFKICSDEQQSNQENFVKSMKFTFNLEEGQWGSTDRENRSNERRPCLTSNKLAKFVAQVVNAERGMQNLEDIIPVDDQGDPAIAKLINEIIEDIEYTSDAESAYNMAGEYAVAGGFGYWRILTEYSDDSFNQEIKIKPIENPLLVYKDKRNRFAFIRECLPTDEFKETYPESSAIDFESNAGYDNYELWWEDDKIWIAEFFLKEPCEKEIAEIMDSLTGETAVIELTKENKLQVESLGVLRRRKIKTHKIMWYKITGSEILDKKEWPGKDIPIIEVVGHSISLEGKTYKKSLTDDAQDNNRMYNTWLTSLTEKATLSPKAPFMVTQSQIQGHEKQWQEANIKNFPYLIYNGVNPPQRVVAPPIDSAALQMLQIADNDIKDCLGMYEASVGQVSNERSGKAILARSARSDQAISSFPDNLRRAKAETKKQLIDLIPKIYDNERVIRLRKSDDLVRINMEVMGNNGEPIIINDLSKGRYDVRVKSDITPSRRQQIADNMLSAMQYAPAYADLILPLVFKYTDAPGAEEITQAIQQRTQQIAQQNNQVPTQPAQNSPQIEEVPNGI